MRTRDVFLALLIVTSGLVVTGAHRGVFRHWQQTATNLSELCLPYSRAWAQGEDWREVERFAREIDSQRVASLIVDNPNGQVIVTGGKQTRVRVEASRYGRGRSQEEAFPRAQRAALSVTRSGRTITITVTGPEGFWRDGRLDLHLAAPELLVLQLKTAGGLVNVQGMRRSVQAATVSGNLEVTDSRQVNATSVSGAMDISHVSGAVTARSVSGQVSVRQASGDVDASTVSGDVALEAVKGALSAATVSGSVVVQSYAGSEAAINTTSGRVTASLSRPLSGRLSAHTLSGSVLATVPADSDCVVDLASRSGGIGSNLPLHQVERAHGHLHGQLGAGRGELTLTSVSGAVAANAVSSSRDEDSREFP